MHDLVKGVHVRRHMFQKRIDSFHGAGDSGAEAAGFDQQNPDFFHLRMSLLGARIVTHMLPNTKTENGRAAADDVAHSVGELVRAVQALLDSAAGLAERELAMAIRVAERVRDEVIAKEALHEARERPILSAFRRDAVGIVNLAADAGALTVHNLSKLATGYTEHLGPPVTQTHLRGAG